MSTLKNQTNPTFNFGKLYMEARDISIKEQMVVALRFVD